MSNSSIQVSWFERFPGTEFGRITARKVIVLYDHNQDETLIIVKQWNNRQTRTFSSKTHGFEITYR